MCAAGRTAALAKALEAFLASDARRRKAADDVEGGDSDGDGAAAGHDDGDGARSTKGAAGCVLARSSDTGSDGEVDANEHDGGAAGGAASRARAAAHDVAALADALERAAHVLARVDERLPAAALGALCEHAAAGQGLALAPGMRVRPAPAPLLKTQLWGRDAQAIHIGAPARRASVACMAIRMQHPARAAHP